MICLKYISTTHADIWNISAGSHRQGDTIWISNLKKGGIASRMGMLQSGDVLLAVNGESLENATLRDAAKMLRNAGDVVTLTVSKESGEWSENVC